MMAWIGARKAFAAVADVQWRHATTWRLVCSTRPPQVDDFQCSCSEVQQTVSQVCSRYQGHCTAA